MKHSLARLSLDGGTPSVVAREVGTPAVAAGRGDRRRVGRDGRRLVVMSCDPRRSTPPVSHRVVDRRGERPAEVERDVAVERRDAGHRDRRLVLDLERGVGRVGRDVEPAGRDRRRAVDLHRRRLGRRGALPELRRGRSRTASRSATVDERVSAMNVLKHLPPRSLSVRLMPPSKNSEVRRLWPTPSCLFDGQPRVVIVPVLTVAQAVDRPASVVRRRPAVDAPSGSTGVGSERAVGAAVPAVDVDRADDAAVGERGDDQQVAVAVVARERGAARPATRSSRRRPGGTRSPRSRSPVLAFRSRREVEDLVAVRRRVGRRIGVHDVDLAVDVVASRLHCHPG